MRRPVEPTTRATPTCDRVRKLSEAKNSGPDLYPIVNTNRLKKIDLNSAGITKFPSCPSITATISVQAVAPIENPIIRSRPRNVPKAIASSRKISGAVEMTDLIASIGAILQPPARSDRFHSNPLIQIKPAGPASCSPYSATSRCFLHNEPSGRSRGPATTLSKGKHHDKASNPSPSIPNTSTPPHTDP